MPLRLLFLCTGNFYRSRFAEIFFNEMAARAGLDWQADSRGIMTELLGSGWGPISPHVLTGLACRGIELTGPIRLPEQLQITDLESADRIIALEESEHRPYLANRFPGWDSQVEYWHVHDLHRSRSEDALADIERRVLELIAEYAGRND